MTEEINKEQIKEMYENNYSNYLKLALPENAEFYIDNYYTIFNENLLYEGYGADRLRKLLNIVYESTIQSRETETPNLQEIIDKYSEENFDIQNVTMILNIGDIIIDYFYAYMSEEYIDEKFNSLEEEQEFERNKLEEITELDDYELLEYMLNLLDKDANNLSLTRQKRKLYKPPVTVSISYKMFTLIGEPYRIIDLTKIDIINYGIDNGWDNYDNLPSSIKIYVDDLIKNDLQKYETHGNKYDIPEKITSKIKVWGENVNYNKDFQPFRWDTNTPSFDNIIKNPEYHEKEKGIVVHLYFMSTIDYLSKCAELHGTTFEEEVGDIINYDLVDKYAKEMLDGDKFPLPVLIIKRNKDRAGDQEGRHRVLAIQKLMYEKKINYMTIPVIIIEKD